MKASWAAVQDALGVSTAFDDYFALIGRPFTDIMAILGLENVAEAARRTYFHASRENAHLLNWYSGAIDMLLKLTAEGRRCGIVTSKERERTLPLLESLPVSFVTVQTPNGLYRGKPAPDHLLVACAEANCDPAESVYVGDMVVDAAAAKRAGIRFLHAAWGYGATLPGCEVVGHPYEILEKLRKNSEK